MASVFLYQLTHTVQVALLMNASIHTLSSLTTAGWHQPRTHLALLSQLFQLLQRGCYGDRGVVGDSTTEGMLPVTNITHTSSPHTSSITHTHLITMQPLPASTLVGHYVMT